MRQCFSINIGQSSTQLAATLVGAWDPPQRNDVQQRIHRSGKQLQRWWTKSGWKLLCSTPLVAPLAPALSLFSWRASPLSMERNQILPSPSIQQPRWQTLYWSPSTPSSKRTQPSSIATVSSWWTTRSSTISVALILFGQHTPI